MGNVLKGKNALDSGYGPFRYPCAADSVLKGQ